MYPYLFFPLFVRTYPLKAIKLSAGSTDATTGATESPAGLNNNMSSLLFAGDDSILNSGGNKVEIIIVYLIIILSLVAVLFFVRKFLLKRVKGFNNGKRMRVSDRIIISQDKQIIMVELAGKMMIVGVTNHTVNQLALLDKEECAEFIEENGSAFGNILFDKLGSVKRQSGNVGTDMTDVNKKDE